jgi:uncharacterized Zn finger protein (UPF0148 family)
MKKRSSADVDVVLSGAISMTDQHCSDCGRELSEVGGGNCQTCEAAQ